MNAKGISIGLSHTSVTTDGGIDRRGKAGEVTSPSTRFPRSVNGGLRLVDDPDPAALPASSADISDFDARAPRLSIVGQAQRVVLAGGAAARRAAVHEQLADSLPRARLLEAADVWEVLQLAPRASLVVLAGDLHDAAATAVMRLLAHRHPDLNVISLADSTADPATAR